MKVGELKNSRLTKMAFNRTTSTLLYPVSVKQGTEW